MKSSALVSVILAVSVAAAWGDQHHYSHKQPVTDGSFISSRRYIEDPPADYKFPSDETYEAFQDMKYGIRLHWGMYSMIEQQHESWPFLNYNDTYRDEYQQLYKHFNPTEFDADEWMKFFSESGFKMFAFTTKHHEGFSMFHTKTKVTRRMKWSTRTVEDVADHHYSVMESPFGRDIVKELTDAARKIGDMKICLYFSHPDWYDVDFRPYGYHPVQTPDSCDLLQTNLPGSQPECEDFRSKLGDQYFEGQVSTASSTARMMGRHGEQLNELLSNYGKIDMVSLDIQLGPKVWPELRETMTRLRKIQPEVMFRARGIGNWGDYYTPEDVIPDAKSNGDAPWFVIYPLGTSFSYDPDAKNYKGAEWIVNSLVDTISKGGNFQLGIGPDKHGKFHPTAVQQITEAGEWIKVNNEAIYGTRARGENMWNEFGAKYTKSKSGIVYMFLTNWPGQSFYVTTIRGHSKTTVRMLGWSGSIPWKQDGNAFVVNLPSDLSDPSKRPCKYIWTFAIENAEEVQPGRNPDDDRSGDHNMLRSSISLI